jgi:hypothetical protein
MIFPSSVVRNSQAGQSPRNRVDQQQGDALDQTMIGGMFQHNSRANASGE